MGTLKEAYLYVVERRKCIRPNISFLQQLWKYENTIFGDEFEHSIKYKDLQIISRLQRKWNKEMDRKGKNSVTINRAMIMEINDRKVEVQSIVEEGPDDALK